MHLRMDRCIDVCCTNGWTTNWWMKDGSMADAGARMHANGWMDGWVDGLIERMDGLDDSDGWMDRLID